MKRRLASQVREVLADRGIDVVTSATGTSRHAVLNLIDPDDFNEVRRILAGHRLGARRIAVDTVEVVARDNVKPDRADDEDVDQLIATWRTFIAKSGQSGFRKANRVSRIARKALKEVGTIAAAKRVLAEVEALEGVANVRRFAAALRHALREARKTGKADSIRHLMGTIAASSPSMRTVDPGQEITPPDPGGETSVGSGRRSAPRSEGTTAIGRDEPQSAASRRPTGGKRKSGYIQQVRDQAMQFLSDVANQQVLDAHAVRQLGVVLDQNYQSWRQTVPSLDDSDAQVVWSAAADLLAHEMHDQEQQGGLQAGPDQGIGMVPQQGYASAVASIFDDHGTKPQIRRAGKRKSSTTLNLVEQLIEHAVAELDKHPEDLTDRDVQRFLDAKGKEDDFDKVRAELRQVLDEAIPTRNDDDDGYRETSREDDDPDNLPHGLGRPASADHLASRQVAEVKSILNRMKQYVVARAWRHRDGRVCVQLPRQRSSARKLLARRLRHACGDNLTFGVPDGTGWRQLA